MFFGKAGSVCSILAFFFFLLPVSAAFGGSSADGDAVVISISDWKTGEVLAESEARAGEEFFFGWIHSWEKIPWNEYYRIADDCSLILEAITFPAFGAGIPEKKGTVCYTDRDGLIHMEGIGQRFVELVWLNSATATQELKVGGRYFTRGSSLPHHRRLRLVVERRKHNGTEQ